MYDVWPKVKFFLITERENFSCEFRLSGLEFIHIDQLPTLLYNGSQLGVFLSFEIVCYMSKQSMRHFIWVFTV